MLNKITQLISNHNPAQTVSAHCDGPCGVYDPSSARIAGEAVLSMTKKLLALTPPAAGDAAGWAAYNNSFSRFVQIKEEQAHLAKEEILVLWTDFFKPVHLETYPDLHDIVWNATKLCSAAKQHVSLESAEALMESIQRIHEIFWEVKSRDIPWFTAS